MPTFKLSMSSYYPYYGHSATKFRDSDDSVCGGSGVIPKVRSGGASPKCKISGFLRLRPTGSPYFDTRLSSPPVATEGVQLPVPPLLRGIVLFGLCQPLVLGGEFALDGLL